MSRRVVFLKERMTQPEFYTLIFSGCAEYSVYQGVHYTLDDALVRANEVDGKNTYINLWWHFNIPIDIIIKHTNLLNLNGV